MKKSILLFSLWAFYFTSCEKSSADTEQNDLIGRWNLVKITGGITGGGYPAPFDAVEFKSSEFVLSKAKALILQGSYTLNSTKDTLNITSGTSTTVYFPNEPKKSISIEKNEKLILRDPCCDLYEYEFSKSKD
jgi:hypothetical protein